MTATPNPNDLSAVLDQLQQAEPDLLRSMLTAFVQALMSADADAVCGAEFGIRSRIGPTAAMAIDSGSGTPGPARSSWRFPSCGRARTSPTGHSSAASGPNER